MPTASGFSVIDTIALGFFFFVWLSHYYIVNQSRWSHLSITARMTQMREQWMLNVVVRGDSPKDAIIQTGLQQGVLFFASTTVLLIGGLVAGLGAAERGVAVLQDIPFTATTSSAQWELKILFIIFIFVLAFFKFGWSYRLYNYTLIMIGAAPQSGADERELTLYARRLTKLHALAARHFTTGLNAYFFALAAFTWFVNAWVFMLATIWVALILYRRAFYSEFLKLLNSTDP
jgi:uncharacterized membrane protein